MGAVAEPVARRPLCAAAVLFAGGVALAAAPLPDCAWPWLAAAGLLAAAAGGLSRIAPGFATAAALLAFLPAGAGMALLRASVDAPPADGTEELLEGTVADRPVYQADRVRFVLEVSHAFRAGAWTPARFRARLSAAPAARLLSGDRVRVRASLSGPPPALNPGAPDLVRRAHIEGVASYGAVLESQLAVLGRPRALEGPFGRLRDRYTELTRLAVGDPQAAALIGALAIGERAALSEDTNEDFNASGLAHVLSVSGLHIAVVAAGLFRVLRWLLARSERLLLACNVRALAALAAVPATWGYVALTGADVPAVRSGIMASAVFVAIALGRDQDGLSSVGAALLAVLAWDPASLHSVSFQLSFAAVAGLMLLTRPLRALVPVRAPPLGERGPRALIARAAHAAITVAVGSLAASLATAPLVAQSFHRASLVAVVANTVALPVASGLTVLCAASAGAFAALGNAAVPLVLAAEPLARLLLWLSDLFANLPLATATVAAPSALSTLGWYGLLVALALEARHRRRVAVVAAVLGVAGWAPARVAAFANRDLTVTFLSVGQGDSTLVRFPGGASLLVDGGGDPGGRFDPGERVVVPALLELGVTRLDVVALSHPHPDHVLGLRSVLRRLGAGELWVGRRGEQDPLGDAFLELARGQGAHVRTLAAGDVIDAFAPARVEVLHPPADDLGLDGNDASVVLRISLGEVSFLLAGDIEARGEALLAESGTRATVLKAPHHGSATSSSESFVERVRPGHVVFCVGRRNRYGFPAAEVVTRYEAAGCRIHRTDRDGAITFRTNGRRLEVEPFVR